MKRASSSEKTVVGVQRLWTMYRIAACRIRSADPHTAAA